MTNVIDFRTRKPVEEDYTGLSADFIVYGEEKITKKDIHIISLFARFLTGELK